MRNYLFLLALFLLTITCSKRSDFVNNDFQDEKFELRNRGPAPKISICHLDEEGDFNLIEVNQNAEKAHLKHGDGYPDKEYKDGYFLTSKCELISLCTCTDGLEKFADGDFASYSIKGCPGDNFWLVSIQIEDPGSKAFQIEFDASRYTCFNHFNLPRYKVEEAEALACRAEMIKIIYDKFKDVDNPCKE